MRKLLQENNEDLLRDIEHIRTTLQQQHSNLLPELRRFYEWLINRCEELKTRILDNLNALSLGDDSILPDILSNTQVITRALHVFNRFLLSPVIRSRISDRLCLRVLNWLHSEHDQTRDIPAAFSDGSFASWPDPRFPTIYFMPPSAQHRLLYLPLFFHEFGHLLYACHRQEMDDLVKGLQQNIAHQFQLGAQHDDPHATKQHEWQNIIVETWFEWAHEMFCDAIGLVGGGPAFAQSFSMYFRMLGRDEYHLKPEYLTRREHPVTWLRVRLIADRAEQMGFKQLADSLNSTWLAIAEEIPVAEDHYGFYVPEFLPAIRQTIDDMLEEASPRRFLDSEIDVAGQQIESMSPVALVNRAWEEFYNRPNEYSDWEKSAVMSWLGD